MTGLIVAVVLAPLILAALWCSAIGVRMPRRRRAPFRLHRDWYAVPGPQAHRREPDPGLDWWEA